MRVPLIAASSQLFEGASIYAFVATDLKMADKNVFIKQKRNSQ
jgi:hypothetical protein